MKRAIYIILIFMFIILFTSCNTIEFNPEIINNNNNVNVNINNNSGGNNESVTEKEELLNQDSGSDAETANVPAAPNAAQTSKDRSSSIPTWLYALIIVIGVLFIIIIYRIIKVRRERERIYQKYDV